MLIQQIAFTVATAWLAVLSLSAAEVKNLKVGQVGDKAVATYDLVAARGEKNAEVSVSITVNGQVRSSDQLHLVGAFGKVVRVGKGKKITWDIVKDLPADFNWHTGNSKGTTHPVGQKQANSFGLYDMNGNVDQWCQDWFDDSYYANSPTLDPPGAANGKFRIQRG